MNLRKSFDEFVGVVQEYICEDSESGYIFTFFSKNRKLEVIADTEAWNSFFSKKLDEILPAFVMFEAPTEMFRRPGIQFEEHKTKKRKDEQGWFQV